MDGRAMTSYQNPKFFSYPWLSAINFFNRPLTVTYFYSHIRHLFPVHLLYWANLRVFQIPCSHCQLLQWLVCRFWWTLFCYNAWLTDSHKTRPSHQSFSRNTCQTGRRTLEWRNNHFRFNRCDYCFKLLTGKKEDLGENSRSGLAWRNSLHFLN